MSKKCPEILKTKICLHNIWMPLSESCSEIIGHEAAQIQGDKIYNYLKKGTV